MDLDTLTAQLESSRRFETAVEGVKFQLRMPSDYAWRVALEDNKDVRGRTKESQAMRQILEGAITGWDGLKADHILPGTGPDRIPFSSSARSILLDARPDLADELAFAIANRVNDRKVQLEDSRKN